MKPHNSYAAMNTEQKSKSFYHSRYTIEDLEREYWEEKKNSKFIDRNAGSRIKSNRKCEQDAFDNLDLFFDEEEE